MRVPYCLAVCLILATTASAIVLSSGSPNRVSSTHPKTYAQIDDRYVADYILSQMTASNDDVVKTIASRVLGEVSSNGATILAEVSTPDQHFGRIRAML